MVNMSGLESSLLNLSCVCTAELYVGSTGAQAEGQPILFSSSSVSFSWFHGAE